MGFKPEMNQLANVFTRKQEYHIFFHSETHTLGTQKDYYLEGSSELKSIFVNFYSFCIAYFFLWYIKFEFCVKIWSSLFIILAPNFNIIKYIVSEKKIWTKIFGQCNFGNPRSNLHIIYPYILYSYVCIQFLPQI